MITRFECNRVHNVVRIWSPCCNMLRVENWTIEHAQAQHCWANLAKQLQHYSTFTDFALKNLTIFKMKVKNDHCSEFSNVSNWKEEAWKNQGFNRIWTCDLCEYRCDALATELWSHTLGARSIFWAHMSWRSEMAWSIYEIIHLWTVVIDEREEWSSQ